MSEKGSNNPKMLKLDVEKSRKRSLEDLNESYISNRKVERFPKIFSIIMEEEEAEISPVEPKDSEDGAIDIVLTVAKKISQLSEGDIDSLKLPKIITKLLKTLKAIVGLLKLEDAKDKSNAEGEKDRLEQLLKLL